MRISITLVCGLIASPCLGQKAAFDAASVKLVDPAHPTWGVVRDPGRIHYSHAYIISLLTEAYGVENDQIAGGPGWLRDLMGGPAFVIDVTMPPDTTKEQRQQMLQNLLAERFHLVVHRETRNFPGYELVVAKEGPKMTVATPDPQAEAAAAAGPQMPKRDKDGSFILPPGSRTMDTISTGAYWMKGQERSMAQLAADLGHMISQALGADMIADFGKPTPRVVDKTGLTGVYNFKLQFSCLGCKGLSAMAPNLPIVAGRSQADAPAASEPVGGGLPTIFAALEQQLGLKLEKVKDVPLEVIVVDRVEKAPGEN